MMMLLTDTKLKNRKKYFLILSMNGLFKIIKFYEFECKQIIKTEIKTIKNEID
jgi:hypothetical protein